MKKTLLYIIDSLERGGAEIMLVSPLAEIYKEYNIIIVTLTPGNAFTEDELFCDKIYCLNMQSKMKILSAVRLLKRIIKDHHVALVHSFLYWSSIVARLAIGKKIPYIFSLATVMSSGVYKLKWYSGYTLLLDRHTFQKNYFIISPTELVLQDFIKSTGVKARQKVLPNFVNQQFFNNEVDHVTGLNSLKLVAVGNLKDVKNYQLLVDAFKLLHDYDVSLDIYGEGPERQSLQNQITEYGLAIALKGSHDKIYEVLPHYDAYVMCSYIEGFGISAAEAMATGLPSILSDLKVLREISHGNALFFDPFNPESFAAIIKDIFDKNINLSGISAKAKEIAKDNYTKEKYLKGLFEVYDEVSNVVGVNDISIN